MRALACLPLPRALAPARDVYVLQFYLRGERMGATIQLRRHNYNPTTGKLTWQAEKRGPEKEAILHPEAQRILAGFEPVKGSPFLLPFLPANYDTLSKQIQLSKRNYVGRQLNEALEEIGKRAGFDLSLRTHSARHTFATIADNATGNNARAIQKMLGHSNLRTTEVYLTDLTSQ
jgi:integrase/recombinase XerD